MKRLFVILLIATTAAANERSYRSLQSGWFSTATPVTDHGLHGEGQIIAVLDTGVDYDNCYFAEADGSRPPVNLGSTTGGLEWQNVNLNRRKIVAYDFLWSCAQHPGARGCDDPNDPLAWDNNGHGTHNAAIAVGDSGAPIVHDPFDALASAAKLIVQDGGLVNGDACSQRPGFGCPVNLTPILDQAYKQGARIHSNSWGDRQNAPPYANPPTGNYSQSARDVDAFVAAHPDMLIVFDTGNYGSTADVPPTPPPARSIAAPGTAKNVLQVGGTRPNLDHYDNTLSYNTLFGPTWDGRIKPDVVGPSLVTAATGDRNVTTNDCNTITTEGPGTSWSAPSIAGAAALVRQYYTEGFYPTGSRDSSHAIIPSAALLKATIIAAARRVPQKMTAAGDLQTLPVPSYEQGFGFPVLDDALYFDGDRSKLRLIDAANDGGLSSGQTTTLRLNVLSGTPLQVVLVWTDPAGIPRSTSDSTAELVHDLDLRVSGPAGLLRLGNDTLHPGQPDRLNNVEAVSIPQPVTGDYTITINASRVGAGLRQGYALVVTGDVGDATPYRSRSVRRR